jgi:type II secretory pathway component PulK
MYRITRLSKGQTIVEAIVVIGVVVLLVTGLIAGTTTSLRSATSGRVRSQALKFAEEGLEYARTLRDERWDTFQTYSGLYCLASPAQELVESSNSSCASNITTQEGSFARSLDFSWDGDKMTVEVIVAYPEGTQRKSISLKTYFTQWR